MTISIVSLASSSSAIITISILVLLIIQLLDCYSSSSSVIIQFVSAQVVPTTGAGTAFPNTVPYPSSTSRWQCPSSCGQAANDWCSRIFGLGGTVTAQNCRTDPDVGVISFYCSCNGGGVGTTRLNAIEIVHLSQLTTALPTSAPPATSSTTAVPTSTNNNTNITTTSTSIDPTATNTSTTSTEVNQTETSTTTTTTTMTTIEPASPSTPDCLIASETPAFFQESPFGMFCRATTGSCPSRCSTATDSPVVVTTATPLGNPTDNGGEGSQSDSTLNPSLLPFVEDCQFGVLSCQRVSATEIVSTCQSCNAGSYRMTTTLASSSADAPSKCAYTVDYSGGGTTTISRQNDNGVGTTEVVSKIDITSRGSCSGQDRCSGNGCCTQFGSCNCFSSNLWGFYGGGSCGSCASGWLRDSLTTLCTVEIPPVLRLLDLLGSRPSAIVAPVLVVAAVSVAIAFLARSRWVTDQERYVVPAGVSLVDPATGYSVSPNSRFFIPPRPMASRGVVNMRAMEKEREMMEKIKAMQAQLMQQQQQMKNKTKKK